MLSRYLQIASTPAVKAQRERYGSQSQYARIDGSLGLDEPPVNDRIGQEEAEFIAARDGFYLASVSETGWPYVQFRGGPAGFLQVLDEKTLAFADFRGNRQYITAGNVAGNDRVSLFLMDYVHQRRLKIFGHMQVEDVTQKPEAAGPLRMPGYKARIERIATITVEAIDWNCPQHITPRFTQAELEAAMAPVARRIEALERENKALRERLNSDDSRGA